MPRLLLMLAVVSALVCCGVDPGAGASAPELSGTPCRVVSVNSDYASTSVTLLDAEGRLCADTVISSGSAPPGLVTALSGDVVPASARHPDGWVVLIDRYPNSVLTFMHPDEHEVLSQLAVGTGFAANPRDVTFLSRTRAYVSRAETNRAPGREPYDGGGDVLVVDPSVPEITGRISLVEHTDSHGGAAFDPRPGSFAETGGLVWVHLHHLSGDLSAAGPGLVLGIDPETDAVARALRLDAFSNCGALDSPRGAEGFWVACSGRFGDASAQLSRSGLAWVDLSDGEPRVAWSAPASELLGQPLSFSVAARDERVIYAVLFGDLAGERSDVLVRVDRGAVPAVRQVASAGAYELGRPLISTERSLLMVPRGNPEVPSVLRFEIGAGGSLSELSPTDPDPSVGLPPRYLGWFR